MAFVGIMFSLSIVGIIALLFLKRWEKMHERRFFPNARRVADELAINTKQFLIAGTRDLEKLPPLLLYLLRALVHVGAVAFGHLAHWIGERSHALADLVSHKHRFERQPPRSEFLKQVNEHSMKSRTNSISTVPTPEEIDPPETAYSEANAVMDTLPSIGGEISRDESKTESAAGIRGRKGKWKIRNGKNGGNTGESV